MRTKIKKVEKVLSGVWASQASTSAHVDLSWPRLHRPTESNSGGGGVNKYSMCDMNMEEEKCI